MAKRRFATNISNFNEQHIDMESIADHGYSDIEDGTKVHHFLQGIKSTELETPKNFVKAQPEKYDKDFDMTVFYLGQMVTKEGYAM